MESESITYYRIKPKSRQIENAAEKIFKDRKRWKEEDAEIAWDEFTAKYMLLDLPISQLDYKYWVTYRCMWVYAINNYFKKVMYPCSLFVIPSKGVCMKENTNVLRTHLIKRTRKTKNVLQTNIDIFESLKESYPEAKKIISCFVRMNTENLHSFYSRIANSNLPAYARGEMLNIIRKSLPEADE